LNPSFQLKTIIFYITIRKSVYFKPRTYQEETEAILFYDL